ncbi:MAG: SpoVG family protein [Melioribacteraceae bacterium]|nr:SpoVG family protein [Melioribacteraceae bacterium]MCF8412150.1 SpoVG family protein [Melioribacteraceae bacterium]MCF8432230.1 SpoVG family protein [Melioribacteraceae bacterium]
MTISRMNLYDGGGKTVAFFDLETEEKLVVKGFSLINGPKGLFVGVPSEKGKDDKYYDKILMPQEVRNQLNEMAATKYEELKN